MWSIGVILYIMACGKMPFDDNSIKRLIKDQLGNSAEMYITLGTEYQEENLMQIEISYLQTSKIRTKN